MSYRKRSRSHKGRAKAAHRRSSRKFRPGYDRTGGYYGRYGPQAISQELKYFDVTADDGVVAAAGYIQSINTIPQGVTATTRVGRVCTIKSIGFHYCAILPDEVAVSTVISDTLRVMVILDKQANGATAAVTDVLNTAHWQSFNNLANSKRFRVLYDKYVELVPTGISLNVAGSAFAQSELVKRGSFYKKCNIPLEFSGTTGAQSEIKSNNLLLLLISASGTVGFQSKFRVRFTDS